MSIYDDINESKTDSLLRSILDAVESKNMVTLPSNAESVAPDFVASYARLAPLVSEAFAYLECGNTEKAMEALREARSLIAINNQFALVIEAPLEIEK